MNPIDKDIARFSDILQYNMTEKRRSGKLGSLSQLPTDLTAELRDGGLYVLFEPEDEPRPSYVGEAECLGDRLWDHEVLPRSASKNFYIAHAYAHKIHASNELLLFSISWHEVSKHTNDTKQQIGKLKSEVNDWLKRWSFTWVPTQKTAARFCFEANAIALLSRAPRRRSGWLGHSLEECRCQELLKPGSGRFKSVNKILRAGLWNVEHVELEPTHRWLEEFEEFVRR